MSVTGMLLALLASFCVLSRPLSQQFASLLLGGAGPVAALLTLTRLEQGEHRLAVYLAVPLSGALVALVDEWDCRHRITATPRVIAA